MLHSMLRSYTVLFGFLGVLVGASSASADWLGELKNTVVEPIRDATREKQTETEKRIQDATKDAIDEAEKTAYERVTGKEYPAQEAGPDADETAQPAAVAAPEAPAAASEQAVSAGPRPPAPTLPTAAVPAVDIVGLRLGMDPEEASQVIAEHLPSMRIYQLKTRGDLGARQAPNGEPMKHVEEIWLDRVQAIDSRSLPRPTGRSMRPESIVVGFPAPPTPPRAVAILRELEFGTELPTVEAIRTALIAKYGEPTDPQRTPHTLIWSWRSSQGPQCRGTIPDLVMPMGENIRENEPDRTYSTWNFSQVGAFYKGCGVALAAEIRTDTNRELARGVRAILIDYDELARADEASRAYGIARFEQERAAEVEQAKKSSLPSF